MPRNDLQTLAHVASHLRYLRDEWDDSMSDESLSRSSNTLRILLVDQRYSTAWRIAGFDGQPEIPCATVGEGHGVVSTQAGGAEFGGVAVQSMTIYNYAMTAEEVKELYERSKSKPPNRTLPLSKYIESAAIIHNGTNISRREVIEYIANKLGGDHIDKSDRPKEAAKFAVLDNLMTQVKLADKRSPYFELLSIGQAVGRSPDAERLIRRAEEMGATV